ncbi:MAG: mechanosensitive ion channel domain-containing protein [Pseudomonadota bacterium]
MTFRRTAALLTALALLLPAIGLAQSQEGGAPASETPAAEAAAPGAAEADALIRLLENPEARAALVERLRSAAGQAEAGGETEAGAQAPAPAEEPPGSLVQRIGESTRQGVERLADSALAAWGAIVNAPQRLAGLESVADPAVLTRAARDLGLAILVTYAVFLALRRAARPLRARLSRVGETAGFLRTLVLSLGVAALDAVTVLAAWAAAYAIVVFALGEAGQLGLRQTLYLNAFLAVETARLIIRLILRPDTPSLRLLRIPDAGAQGLAGRLSVVALLLGYGLLLAEPIVYTEAGWRASRALGTAISLVAVGIGIVAVLRHRRAVADWLIRGLPDGRRSLAALARLWHLPVLIYLGFLFVIVLARPGGVLMPVLEASGKIAAAVIVGMMIDALLSRRTRKGVRLPGQWTEKLPLLEGRINAVVPKALLVLRLLIGAAVLATALQIAGAWDAQGWLASEIGLRLTGGLFNVALILLFAILVWVAFASWVDWRLSPEVGRPPTSRETTLLSLLRNAAAIALLVITLMFALSELGLDIAPLLASAGVLGLAIGFGAQKMVQDVITGIFIQLENAMNVGDVVTVGGTSGVVEKLTIRSVSLRDLEGVFHVIPFSSVDMVSNYMRDFSYALVDMGVAYREDVEDVRQAMADAFEELRADPELGPDILDELEWFGLNSFGDSAVMLRARIKTVPGKQWGLKRAYNGLLKRIFDERGIEIPFPHQTIYFGEDREGKAPPLRVVSEGARTTSPVGPSGAEGRDDGGTTVPPRQDLPDEEEG